MNEKKKDEEKIKDVTGGEELTKEDMDKVSGGRMGRRPPIMKGPRGSSDCDGNCMGSVPEATGKEVDV